jgi:hypothetical protein
MCSDIMNVPHMCSDIVNVPHMCSDFMNVPHICSDIMNVPHICSDIMNVPHICPDIVNVPYMKSDILYLGSSCAWVGTFAELAGQHRNQCPLASIACPHPGCPWKGVRKGLKQHLVLCLSLSCVCLYMHMYVCICMYMYGQVLVYALILPRKHHKHTLKHYFHFITIFNIFLICALTCALYVPSYVPQMNTKDQYKPWHGPAGAGCLGVCVCVTSRGSSVPDTECIKKMLESQCPRVFSQ